MKEGLLQKEEERRYHLYHAHSESFAFLKLQQAFYMEKLKGLLEYIEEECVNPVIILFGSFAKGEVNSNSDIDIAVFTPTKKSLSLKPFEAKFKREVHLFMFKGQEDLKESRELLSNILNGCILSGSW
jgi:predicted nucleotidyltransferase